MQIGPYRFRPNLFPSLIIFVGLIVLVKLGYWQLARADEKKQILQDIEYRKTSQELSLDQLDGIGDKNYYRLKLQGQFDNIHYLLLDNRIYNGRPGFEVIQPFITQQRIVLINRGWIPLADGRQVLPTIPATDGMITLTGEVHIPTSAIVLVEDILNADQPWPKLIQSIVPEALAKLYQGINMPVEPWILRQDIEGDYYQHSWIYINMSPQRHIAYAFTWFGLALALIIIYIAAATSREELKVGSD